MNHQQALKKDTTAVISKFSDMHIQNKNGHFLADSQTYYGNGDKSFTGLITQVEIISHLNQHMELQLARAKKRV